MTDETIYDRVIYEDLEKFFQWRVTINRFYGTEYFHMRKYIMDFDGLWVPVKDGVSFPLDLSNVNELFIAMLEILSLGESKEMISKHFSELLQEVYEK